MEKVVRECREIFKRHSITYYYSTLLFPQKVRHNVYILYAFVRLADEYVDNPEPGVDPQNSLEKFRALFEMEWNRQESGDPVVARFVLLAREFEFDKKWIDAFLESMSMDLYIQHYDSFATLEKYIYGSAEVIGLMMSRVMGIAKQFDTNARALGKSMQLINFLRDIKEDSERGRIYFPQDELAQYDLDKDNWMNIEAGKHTDFVHYQIQRIKTIQKTATLHVLTPFRVRNAVTLASEGYHFTLEKIEQHPTLPFTSAISNTKWDIAQVFIRTLLPL